MAKQTQKKTISDAQLKSELFKLFNGVGVNNYHLYLHKNPVNYYIYGLFDTSENTIFYIGKGKGKRGWCHFKLTGINIEKEKYIQNLTENNIEIKVLVLMDNLSEGDALYYESILISENYQKLTNIQCNYIENPIDFYIKKYGKDNVIISDDVIIEDAEECELDSVIKEYKEVQLKADSFCGIYSFNGKKYFKNYIDNFLESYA